MEITSLAPFVVFLAIAGAVWAVFAAFSGGESRVAERLEELKDPRKRQEKAQGEKESGVGAAFKKAAPALSKAFQPKTELEQSKLKVKLANAGFSSATAPTLFLAMKLFSMVLGLFIGGGVAVFTKGFTVDGLFILIGGVGVGMYLPDLVLMVITSGRKDKIFLSLPDALDLMVVCVEAGLGLDAAMRRVCDELDDSAPEICSEMKMCNMQLQMGRPRREVLHDFGVRTGVDDVRALAAILIQAEKFGSSIAQALRVQSESMRIKRSQLAEEKAAQTAVKMIFPLVLFIFPGIFVVLVGPAAIMMIRQLLTN